MSETPLLSEQQGQTAPQPQNEDDFAAIQAMQAEDMQRARAASQRFIDATPVQSQPEVTLNKKGKFVKNAAILSLSAASVAGVGVVAHDALSPPEFSEEKTTYVVEPGDGLYNAAEEIAGIETVRLDDAANHIAVDPANIDVLKDGLQPGEQLSIPVSVKGYEEPKE